MTTHLLAQAPLILPNISGPQTIVDPVGFGSLGEVVTKVSVFVFAFAGFALLLMIVASGFSLLTSAGDAKKLESGKQRLTWALIGFIVVFSAFWITQIVGKIFGVTEFQSLF